MRDSDLIHNYTTINFENISSGKISAKRPTSFNQSLIMPTGQTRKFKYSNQINQNSINITNNSYSLYDSNMGPFVMLNGNCNYKPSVSSTANSLNFTESEMDLYRLLDTPTTPQFPMPNDSRYYDNFLSDDLSDITFNSNDNGSDEFPWTPDTPSSSECKECKDPLMTDAVNTDNPQHCSSGCYKKQSFSYSFIFKDEPLSPIELKEEPKLPEIKNEKIENSSISTPKELMKTVFNETKLNDHQSLIVSQSIKKPQFSELPFDISAFSFPLPSQTCNTTKTLFPTNTSPSISTAKHSPINQNSVQTNNTNNKRKPRLHLLQFIYCLLNNYKPSQCVCWVDKDNCIFRIINPNKLTNLWGRYKQNPNMSFDSLSRSLRLYYASGRLERVAGQRNQYRFVNREESIDFNRKNKRKPRQQPQLSQTSVIPTTTSPNYSMPNVIQDPNTKLTNKTSVIISAKIYSATSISSSNITTTNLTSRRII